MQIIYNIIIKLLILGMRLGAWTGQKKMQKGLIARKNQQNLWQKIGLHKGQLIWVHAASLGEYEQIRALLTQIHENYPNYEILLTFFSPSGYEHIKAPQYVQYLAYIPFDLPTLMQNFIRQIRPNLVIFVKYELWWNCLSLCRKHKIPLILIAAIQYNNRIQKWYKYFQRQALLQFNYIFTQDEQTNNILANFYPKEQLFAVGDPRIDRIQTLVEMPITEFTWITKFKQNKPIFIGGSIENSDLPLLAKARTELYMQYKSIIVPHEITPKKIQNLQKIFPKSMLFSKIHCLNPDELANIPIIIVDAIGILASLYAHTQICYIGGAWKKHKLHNIMEPIIHTNFVLIGPNFKNFKEAQDLAKQKYIYTLKQPQDLAKTLQLIAQNPAKYRILSHKAQQYLKQIPPSSPKILKIITEKQLLSV